jgi:hypothetical protein
MEDRVILQFKDFVIPASPSMLYERKRASPATMNTRVGEYIISFAAFIEGKQITHHATNPPIHNKSSPLSR